MMVVLLVGALSGASAALAKARVGVLALIACILAAGAVIVAIHSPHPVAYGLLAATTAQMAYLLVGYIQEYLWEDAWRRAMRNAIGQELRTLYVPQTALPREMLDLIKVLDEQ